MSEPVRIALVGATGLIGRAIIAQAVGRENIRLLAIARREMKLPSGATMEMVVADPQEWGTVLSALRPDVLISALGTTWNRAGRDEASFRAVDQTLVLMLAQAARDSGTERMLTVSSVGADSGAKTFYLRVKGEVERDLRKIGFDRLDIMRPGLLRGKRDRDMRIGETVGRIVSPATDLLLHGAFRRYRSIRDDEVARAGLALALRKAGGKFVHEHDALLRAARSLPMARS